MTPSNLSADKFLPRTSNSLANRNSPRLNEYDWDQMIEPYNMTAEECLVKFYREMEIKALASLLGCHRNALMRRAKRLNLGSRNQFRTSGTPYKQDVSKLKELYNSGMCDNCIAKELKRPSGGVKKKIARLIEEGVLLPTTEQCECRN